MLVILGHRFVDRGGKLFAHPFPFKIVCCRAYPGFLILLNRNSGVLSSVMRWFYDRKDHDALKKSVWVLLYFFTRRIDTRARIEGIDLRRIVGSKLLGFFWIVAILLLQFFRQICEGDFHKSSGELDHDSVRFDAAHNGILVLFAVIGFNIVSKYERHGQGH